MRFPCIISVCIALGALSVSMAETPLGTAFTYQGQLKNGGSPANGSFSMGFKLFDALTAGNQIGPTLNFDGVSGDPAPVSVSNGLFTVQLDFGSVFSGDKRWLEVAVTGTTLSPRQELTAAPYARFSAAPWATSGTTIFNTNGGNVGIGTASPTTELHIVDPSVAQFKVERTAGSQFLVQATSTFTRIGTTSSATPLRFLIGGNDQMTLDASGRLGIGTTVPEGDLHVLRASAGTITASANAPLVVENNTSNYVNILAPDANETGVLFGRPGSSAPNAAGGIVFNNSANTDGLQFRTGGNSTKMTIDSDGNVGIGTTAPTAKLHVVASAGDSSVILPNSSISAAEIGDEPGIAANIVNCNDGVDVFSGLHTAASRTINCPTAGFVVAIGTVELWADVLQDGDVFAGINDSSSEFSSCSKHRTTLLAGKRNTVTVQGVFSVTAGNKTIYLLVQPEDSGRSLGSGPAHLTLMFMPTSYGTVNTD